LGDKSGKLLNTLIAHEDAILKLAWSPDGKTLVSSSADKTIKVFRASDLAEIKTIAPQSDWTSALEFSPDGKTFAAGRFDGTFTIYNVEPAPGTTAWATPAPSRSRLGIGLFENRSLTVVARNRRFGATTVREWYARYDTTSETRQSDFAATPRRTERLATRTTSETRS
jgi:dipeptidyl aminopeptidase/acylaminoacyl peptidase